MNASNHLVLLIVIIITYGIAATHERECRFCADGPLLNKLSGNFAVRPIPQLRDYSCNMKRSNVFATITCNTTCIIVHYYVLENNIYQYFDCYDEKVIRKLTFYAHQADDGYIDKYYQCNSDEIYDCIIDFTNKSITERLEDVIVDYTAFYPISLKDLNRIEPFFYSSKYINAFSANLTVYNITQSMKKLDDRRWILLINILKTLEFIAALLFYIKDAYGGVISFFIVAIASRRLWRLYKNTRGYDDPDINRYYPLRVNGYMTVRLINMHRLQRG